MNHRYFITIGIILCLLCLNLRDDSVAQNSDENKPTYNDFISTHTFPYNAPLERQDQIKQNYPRLSTGLTKAQVTIILGEPDYSQQIYSKTKSPGLLGYSWTYIFEKPDPNITNLKKDLSVQVIFDVNGKTKWIVSNIKGFAEIGSP